jgi:hypothetical protein
MPFPTDVGRLQAARAVLDRAIVRLEYAVRTIRDGDEQLMEQLESGD